MLLWGKKEVILVYSYNHLYLENRCPKWIPTPAIKKFPLCNLQQAGGPKRGKVKWQVFKVHLHLSAPFLGSVLKHCSKGP